MKAFHFVLPVMLGIIACSNPSDNFFSDDLKDYNLHGMVKSITAKTTLKVEENTYGIERDVSLTKEFNQKGRLVKEVRYNDFYKQYGLITNIQTEYYYDGDVLAASAIFDRSNPQNERQTQYTEYSYDNSKLLVQERSNVLRDGEIYPRKKDYTYENGKLVREEDLLAMFSREVTKYSYPDDKTTVKWGMSFSGPVAWPSYQWKDFDEEQVDDGWKKTIVHNKKGQIVSIQNGDNKELCTVKYGKTGIPTKIKNGYADMFGQINDQIQIPDEESVVFNFEYEYDKKGNWIKRTEYDGSNKVFSITERKIQYYE